MGSFGFRRRAVGQRLLAFVLCPLSLVLPAAASSFTLTPYVQHPTADAMSIIFFTDSACTATVTCNGEMKTTTGAEATALVACTSGKDIPMWGTQYRHQVRFTGLRAGTKYGYEVKLSPSGEKDTYANTFRTAPAKDSPVRFVAYSDSETCPPPPAAQDTERTDSAGATMQWEKDGAGTKTAYYVSRSKGFEENIRHMMSENPDLILVAGDIAARGGVQMFWDEYWKENAGGLGLGYNDPAGSTPILAALGNHDLYGNKGKGLYDYDNSSSSFAIAKYNTYFEFSENGVDGGQLYHREDYGPVTLLFLDTVKTSFSSGSTQYKWIEKNLADAQVNAMFTIVVSHQTPYSGGKHGNETDVTNVRSTLGPLMIKYGVDAWLCGHCEAQEHSQVPGTEVLPDGTTRPHTVNVYDLGSGGDGLLCAKHVTNTYSVFNSLDDSPDGIHYGHLLIDVKPNDAGVWQLTMTPMYSYIGGKNGTSELRAYPDTIVVDGPAPAKPEFSVTPYVQHPATNGMSIVFFTTESCAAKVKCWRADGKGETNELTTVCVDVSDKLGKNALGNSDTLTYAKQYRHRVRFEGEGMRALTDYRYEVALPGGGTYCNTFRTLPGKDTPVRFIGYCDCETTPNGAATDWSNNGGEGKYFVGLTEGFASNIVHMISRRPDLITISGDIAAKGGYQKNWDEFWRQNAGANGRGYNDPAGSIPILAAIGNHDLKDASSSIDRTKGGESALEKYLTYFEYNPNGVTYDVSEGTSAKETRDMSLLFHREDLGPVTLIFLDTNKGASGYGPDSTQDGSDRPAMRAPDFHPGSLQYNWLTNQLADAQRNSRFTFVINHHCPYSVGQHNRPSNGKGYTGYNTGSGYDGESAQAVRCLTDTMIRYGVDAWLCGHDEIQEHSQTNGVEVLPDGRKRAHTLNVYDLGSGGDGLRGTEYVKNPLEVFRAFKHEPDVWENGVLRSGGCHYGFMEVDVTTNRLGKWTCSLTPCYDFINKINNKAATFELRRYKDRVIIDEESNEIVYQEWKGDRTLPSDYVEYVRPPQASAAPPDEPESWTEEPVWTMATRITLSGGKQTGEQYRGFLTKKGLQYAWGTNGVAKTPWMQGDGTPMELPKPDEEEPWELMVR